jgi:hypothetical protein
MVSSWFFIFHFVSILYSPLRSILPFPFSGFYELRKAPTKEKKGISVLGSNFENVFPFCGVIFV